MQPSPELRVAAVQCPILWNEPEANLRYIEEQLRGQETADLLVFPETILTGFSATAADYADREGRQLEELSSLARRYGKAIAGSLLTALEAASLRPRRRARLRTARHRAPHLQLSRLAHPAPRVL